MDLVLALKLTTWLMRNFIEKAGTTYGAPRRRSVQFGSHCPTVSEMYMNKIEIYIYFFSCKKSISHLILQIIFKEEMLRKLIFFFIIRIILSFIFVERWHCVYKFRITRFFFEQNNFLQKYKTITNFHVCFKNHNIFKNHNSYLFICPFTDFYLTINDCFEEFLTSFSFKIFYTL